MVAVLLTVAGSFAVGVMGAVLGVGGGVFLVPLLTLFGGLRPVEAVAISLFCVIGTSVAGSAQALRSGQANLGLALTLEPVMLFTSVGASLLAHRMDDALLLSLFGVVVAGIGALFLALYRKNVDVVPLAPAGAPRLVDGVMREPDEEPVRYRPARLPALLSLVGVTGVASGLFGIGGGVLNVPWLTMVARVPMRAAASTSVLTMSITGAAAGAVHLAHDAVPAALVAASMIGVVPGGLLGVKVQRLLPERRLRLAFALLALVVALMSLKRAWELT